MRRMTRAALIVVGVLVAVSLVGCAVKSGGASRGGMSADEGLFEEFTESVSTEPEVQTSVESLLTRMPSLGATTVHYAGAYESRQGLVPDQDPRYWLDAVVEVDESAAQTLDRMAGTPSSLLPGIHPDLRQYVPRTCSWNEIPAADANGAFVTEGAVDQFIITRAAFSSDCATLIVRGNGYH